MSYIIRTKNKEKAWEEVEKLLPNAKISKQINSNFYKCDNDLYTAFIYDRENRLDISFDTSSISDVTIWATLTQPKIKVFRLDENNELVKGKYAPEKTWNLYLTKSLLTAHKLVWGLIYEITNATNKKITGMTYGECSKEKSNFLNPTRYREHGYHYYVAEERENKEHKEQIVTCIL